MAVTIDIGDALDLHPKNKRDVGERLAAWALANDYGQKVVHSGPLFKSLQIQGDKAIARFDHADHGLMTAQKNGAAPPEKTNDEVGGFAIAGGDKHWRWAKARIEGQTIVVSHPDVPKPVAVRYAFSANPVRANLYNADGLPASPFRTDNW
jgi:sialate O-acetylesterase